MSKLIEALRKKFQSPEQVLRVLGLDEKLLWTDSTFLKEPEMKSKPLSRHAVLTKGALLGLSASILAADSALDLNKLLAGVTAANWLNKKPAPGSRMGGGH